MFQTSKQNLSTFYDKSNDFTEIVFNTETEDS